MAQTTFLFLGYPTETDNDRFAAYMTAMAGPDHDESVRLAHSFDDLFPGVRRVAVAALREVETSKRRATLLEYKNNKFRATSGDFQSHWHTVSGAES